MKLKEIRFNLRFSKGKDKNGEEQFAIIRSLQDMADNLNVDELYPYYTSGQLSRWLTGIGETSKAETVSNIDRKASDKVQLKELFKTLELDMKKDEMEAIVESFMFSKTLQDRKRELVSILNNVQNVIEQDYVQYNQCLNEIIAAGDDFASIKSRVRAMLKNHSRQFMLDWMRFYDLMMEKCRLAVFAVLMESDYRKYYLGTEEEMNALYYGGIDVPTRKAEAGIRETPIQQFMSRIEKLIDVAYMTGSVGNNHVTKLRIRIDENWLVDVDEWRNNGIIKEVDYAKSDGEWEDAVDKGTKIMILHCGDNVTIRPAGDKSRQGKGTECGRFPIFDGLDFRTKVSTPKTADDILLYMEVK